MWHGYVLTRRHDLKEMYLQQHAETLIMARKQRRHRGRQRDLERRHAVADHRAGRIHHRHQYIFL